jgi:ketosteroid isomerase-like protein
MSVIQKFYEAFSKRDWETMQACYHDEVVFQDPAFGRLEGADAKKMWRMLCEQGKDLKVEFSKVQEADEAGSAHWEAWYTLSLTKRKIHNKIDAQFILKDGLIVNHVDTFDLHVWAKQAFGFKGWLLGGTNFFKKQFQAQARKSLNRYQ